MDLNHQDQRDSFRKISFKRQRSCSSACIWCLRRLWGWTWTWRRGRRCRGSARCRAWYQWLVILFGFLDWILKTSSPVVVLEHLARLVQLPRLCWRQVCVFLLLHDEEVDCSYPTGETEHCNIGKVKIIHYQRNLQATLIRNYNWLTLWLAGANCKASSA